MFRGLLLLGLLFAVSSGLFSSAGQHHNSGNKARRHFVAPLHKHHQVHPKLHHRRWMLRSAERRRKALAKSSAYLKSQAIAERLPTAPVGGDIWPVAIYWTMLNVGTPGKPFPAAIDSGSFTLDIPLINCEGCINTPPNNFYRPSESNTSHLYTCSFTEGCAVEGASCVSSKGYCGFSNTYETCVPTEPTETCTITGVWYQDMVSMAGTSVVPVQFGAINSQTSNFEQFQNIDGVVGMAGPAVVQSVIGQLASSNAIPSWSWAICLKQGRLSNGTITLGGVDPRLYAGSMQYTPDTGGGQFYQMQLNGMTIGGQQINIVEQQVIIDSGTNILLVPDGTYQSIKSILLGMCGSVNLHGVCDVSSSSTLFDGQCFYYTVQQIQQFPNLTISVPGISPIVVPPSSYILQNYGTNFKPGQYCIGIDNTGSNGFQIIGDTVMSGYYVVFDLQNTRIGWAPVSKNCGNLSS